MKAKHGGRLPFYELYSCGLGIATLSYLDNLHLNGDPLAQETQEQAKKAGQDWIQHSDFEASLGDAFSLWDAVSSATLMDLNSNLMDYQRSTKA